MNREYKRAVRRQEAKRQGRVPQVKPAPVPGAQKRTRPRQFLREVIQELRRVAWPSRQEVASYSVVVIVSTTIIGALIFAMDYVFSQAILRLFGIET